MSKLETIITTKTLEKCSFIFLFDHLGVVPYYGCDIEKCYTVYISPCGLEAHRMIHAGRKKRSNGPGQLGQGSTPYFFLCLLFSFLFFIPYERINCPGPGRRFRPLCLAPFFFFALFTCFSFFSLSLTMAGLSIFLIINK